MDANRPAISIVTACYRSAGFIDRLYESLVAQDASLFEWIPVDDKSPDDTVEVLSRLAEKAPFPCRVFALPANSGGPVAMAYGLSRARGDAVIFLDHDDALVSGALSMIADDWRTKYDRRRYCGLLYRTKDPVSGEAHSAEMPPCSMTITQQKYWRGEGYDGLIALDREKTSRYFTFEKADKICFSGSVFRWMTADQPLYYPRNDPVKYYHRDVASSQTNRLVLTRQMVYMYADIINLFDRWCIRSPWIFLRTLFNLIRFSDTVHGSPMVGLQLLKPGPFKILGYCLLPVYFVLRSRLHKYDVRQRGPFPIEALSENLEVAHGRSDRRMTAV